nr:glycosyltransferase family 4 protein [Candidatus Brachybacter algidus]
MAEKKIKILFLSDNYPPEVNAPASRTYEHIQQWVRNGADVTIITCAPNFPQGKVFEGYKNKLFSKTVQDGVTVIRVWSYITANEGFVKRILDYVSYSVTSFFFGLFQRCDIIVATSPQFFTAVSGCWLSIFKRKPWIMEVRDLWPESIKAVSAMKSDSKIFVFLEWIERWLYKRAASIVVVTDTFKEKLVEWGVDAGKIHIVKNGVMLDKFEYLPKNSDLVKQLNLENKFVIGYIGTHGMAHKLDFIVETAAKIKDERVHFLFIGNGAEKEKIKILAGQLKLANCTFLDSVSKDKINEYISITDVSLVPLKKSDTFKTVIPSKIFENSAMLKPILLGVEGEAKGIIEKYKAGICFEPENEKELIAAIEKLMMDVDFYNELKLGCANLARDFDRIKLADKMLEVIKTTFNNAT